MCLAHSERIKHERKAGQKFIFRQFFFPFCLESIAILKIIPP
jgi:hypothetical protein